MKKFKRIFVIVMDSFGAGHAKDGAAYGDDGADSMGHIAEKHDNWKIPNLTTWKCCGQMVLQVLRLPSRQA